MLCDIEKGSGVHETHFKVPHKSTTRRGGHDARPALEVWALSGNPVEVWYSGCK